MVGLNSAGRVADPSRARQAGRIATSQWSVNELAVPVLPATGCPLFNRADVAVPLLCVNTVSNTFVVAAATFSSNTRSPVSLSS